jgi:low affinity Fe/Cu permease
MALYTKQQLMEAYFAKVETNPSVEMDNAWFDAEIIKVQAEIDARIDQLTTRKANLITNGTERVNEIQARIDRIEPDAKEKMKSIALSQIWSQDNAQDVIDTGGVSL